MQFIKNEYFLKGIYTRLKLKIAKSFFLIRNDILQKV